MKAARRHCTCHSCSKSISTIGSKNTTAPIRRATCSPTPMAGRICPTTSFGTAFIARWAGSGIRTPKGVHVGVHCFRHGVTTSLLESGTPIHIVTKLMRHGDSKVTLDHYAHIVSDADRKESEKLSRQNRAKHGSIGVRLRIGVNSVQDSLKIWNLAEACGSRTHHPPREGTDRRL